MNNKLAISGLVVLLIGGSGPALAAGPSPWDSASLSLVLSGELERTAAPPRDLGGYRLGVTKSLGSAMFVRAAANVYSADDSPDIDASTHQIGIGARYPIMAGANPIEIWGSLNYERVDAVADVGTGLGVDVGVRAQLTPQLDLDLVFKVLGDTNFDLVDDADLTGYEISAAYRVRPALSLLFSYSDHELEFDDGSSAEWSGVVSVGVRFHF